MNLNYLIQNIKKSKSFLAFFIGIVPIITVLMLIVGSKDKAFIPSLEELSVINYPCLYILPIIISICLFGYVFKKKSVDFVNSMPISRKQIFITNTIGGIILILLLNLINVILMLVLSSIIPNLVIPFSMLIDYFIYWSVSYIFVFVCANIAISLCGNMITSIALTLLIMFLIPFLHSYITVKGAYLNNVDYSVENIEIANISPVITNNYTAPYGIVFSILEAEDGINLYKEHVLIKMLVLSVLYIIIGLYLFRRRKMEVSETSFKNIYVHNLVKSLTLIPFIVVFFESQVLDEVIMIVIFLVMLIAYYFIFDLITRRSISKITLNLSFLSLFLVLSFVLLIINDKAIDNNKVVINKNEIESIRISTYDYDTAYNFSDFVTDIEIEDKNIISSIINNIGNFTYNRECSNYEQIYIETKDNKKYETYACLDTIDFVDIEDIKEEYNDIDYNEIYAVSIDNKLIQNEELIREIKKQMSMTNIDNDIEKLDYYDRINAYIYEDNKQVIYSFNPNLSKKIKSIYLNELNNQVIELIDTLDIYNISVNSNYEYFHDYNDIDKIKEIIKSNKVVDVEKEYVTIMLYTTKGAFSYSTNEVSKVLEVFHD